MKNDYKLISEGLKDVFLLNESSNFEQAKKYLDNAKKHAKIHHKAAYDFHSSMSAHHEALYDHHLAKGNKSEAEHHLKKSIEHDDQMSEHEPYFK